eukprot:g5260.t1
MRTTIVIRTRSGISARGRRSMTTTTTSSSLPALPTYRKNDEASLPSIVHIGVGNFFRSHLAANTDAVMETEGHDRWTIHGVSLLNIDEERKVSERLNEQNGQYGLVSLPSGTTRVVGSLTKHSWVPESAEVLQDVRDALTSPVTKIVSLTVTEKGYCQDADGNLDVTCEDVAHDIAVLGSNVSSLLRPACRTALGTLIDGLSRRAALSEHAPVTLLSCDNLPHNGGVLRRLVFDMCERIEGSDELLEWIANENNVTFPSSMVDRITPATSPATLDIFRQRATATETAFDCRWPVVAEDFSQWVVEDNFVAGRPNWEQSAGPYADNILFVKGDGAVGAFEDMKLRLLNGSHTAMAYIGTLAGCEKVDEATKHPDVGAFVRAYMNDATCSVPPVPGIDLEDYKTSLLDRFSNEAISDELGRLCQDGSKKFIGFVLPVLSYKLARQGDSSQSDTSRISDVVASWIVYLASFEDASAIDDPKGHALHALATDAVDSLLQSGENDGVRTFLQETLGTTVANAGPFVTGVCDSVQCIRTDGAVALLKRCQCE